MNHWHPVVGYARNIILLFVDWWHFLDDKCKDDVVLRGWQSYSSGFSAKATKASSFSMMDLCGIY